MTTLREHLEAILAHNSPPFPDGRPSMMFNREHAVAALAILDKHRTTSYYACQGDGNLDPSEFYSAVPDPEPSA